MKTVLSALVKQKGHARGAMGLAAKLQADNASLRARIAELETALAPFATTAEQIDREVPSARSQITRFEQPCVDDDDVRIECFPLPDEAFVLHAARQHAPNPVTEMIGLQMCHLRAASVAMRESSSRRAIMVRTMREDRSALASPQREGDRPVVPNDGK